MKGPAFPVEFDQFPAIKTYILGCATSGCPFIQFLETGLPEECQSLTQWFPLAHLDKVQVVLLKGRGWEGLYIPWKDDLIFQDWNICPELASALHKPQ